MANWFTAFGDMHLDMDVDGPMEFPEGKLSIKSTIGEIYRNKEAWKFFFELSGGKFGPDMSMWDMLENFGVEMMLQMAGNLPEGTIKALNKKLNGYDVVK